MKPNLHIDPTKRETTGTAQLLYCHPLGGPARALPLSTCLGNPIPSVVDIMAAASPPQPLIGSFLVGVHHRAHAHRKETVRLGEVHHVELDHRVADQSCRVESGTGRARPGRSKHGEFRGRIKTSNVKGEDPSGWRFTIYLVPDASEASCIQHHDNVVDVFNSNSKDCSN